MGAAVFTLFKVLYVYIGRSVYFLAYRSSVFSPLFDTFGQEVLYLPVDRTEIVLCPGSYIIVQLFR